MHAARSRTTWLWLLLTGGVALSVAFWADAAVTDWVMSHQTRGAREFMRSVSKWGDWPSHIIAGLVCAGLAYWKGNRRWLSIFAAMVIACALAGTATRVIKMTAGRARPAVQVDTGWNGPRLESKYHAFPSGHTAASTAFFATLAFITWRIGAVFLLIPFVIAVSRMYVRAHHISDVVAGALVGALVALAVSRSCFFADINSADESPRG